MKREATLKLRLRSLSGHLGTGSRRSHLLLPLLLVLGLQAALKQIADAKIEFVLQLSR